jgi:hypothetical protein
VFDWLPERQPQQSLTIFALVAALSVIVIVPLALSDGSNGLDTEIKSAVHDARESSTSAAEPRPVTPAPPPSTTTAPPSTLPPRPPRRPPVERAVGQTATDDGLELTVRSLREVSRIKRDSYYHGDFKPTGGGTLIDAEVTYVNHTKAPIDPFCGGNSAALADQDGRTHETIDKLYSIQGNDAICGGSDTLPGDKATVTLAFKLKRGQRVDHLDLWNGKYEPDFDGESTRIRFTRP